MITITDMSFHERLESLREGRGVSARELARQIGSNDSLVWRWLNGKSEPRLSEAVKLAEFFGMTLDELALDGEPKRQKADLPYEDRLILDVFHAVGLSAKEAVRRLAGPPQEFEQVDPSPKARLVGNGGPAR